MKSRVFLGRLDYKLQFVREQASRNVYNVVSSNDVRGTLINHVAKSGRQINYIHSLQTYLHILEYSTVNTKEGNIIERTINS